MRVDCVNGSMRCPGWLVLCLFLVSCGGDDGPGSGSPGVVEDQVPGTGSLLFLGRSGPTGVGLYVTDGTEAGTQLLETISDATQGSEPFGFVSDGTLTLFSADDGQGRRLWRWNSVTDQVELVADVALGSGVIMDGVAYSLGAIGDSYGLWRSDGTPGGTYPLKTGIGFYFPVVYGGQIYFGGQLTSGVWRTDGTGTGTVQVDLPYNVSQFLARPPRILGSRLFLILSGDTELIVDGPVASPVLASDLYSAPGRYYWYGVGEISGKFLFVASDAAGVRLWIEDRATGDVVQVSDVPVDSVPEIIEAVTVGGNLIFAIGRKIYRSDGTVAGTALVADASASLEFANIASLNATSGGYFYIVSNPDGQRQLWFGDASGSLPVKLLEAEAARWEGQQTSNDSLYFIFRSTSGDTVLSSQLWTSDGTLAGTGPVAAMDELVSVDGITKYILLPDGFVYSAYTANDGVELVFQPFAGPASKTTININAWTPPVGVMGGVVLDGSAYAVIAGQYGALSLWRTDGTSEGTSKLDNYQLASEPYLLPWPGFPVRLGDDVYYRRDCALWKTGVSGLSPVLVRDFLLAGGLCPRNMVVAGARLFVSDGSRLWVLGQGEADLHLLTASVAQTAMRAVGAVALLEGVIAGNQLVLLRSDGTDAGTFQLPLPPGLKPGDLLKAAVHQGKAYLPACDGTGCGVWVTNGTVAGSKMLWSTESIEVPGSMIWFDGALYFGDLTVMADDADPFPVWRISPSHPAASALESVPPVHALAVGDVGLFAVSNDAGRGTAALWLKAMDGMPFTSVAEVPGTVVSLRTSGGSLYLAVHSPEAGTELWVSDGTTEGTHAVIDLFPGVNSGLESFMSAW